MTRRTESLLIRNAGLMFSNQTVDVRVRGGIITAVGHVSPAAADEWILDAFGAALLPGLHDHHIHLQALASAELSLRCDPWSASEGDGLGEQLRRAAATGDSGAWLRVIGYHEDIAGDIDRGWLDRHIATRPVRIQHRSGRLWIFNSRALETLSTDDASTPLERRFGRITGRLYDGDAWLRQRLNRSRPSLAAISRRLASHGVTGVTDATHSSSRADFEYLAQCQQRDELLQRVTMMGDAGLDGAIPSDLLATGATKVHLHEHQLPDFAALCRLIKRSHRAGRPIAAHCVTVPELAYILCALSESGNIPGDRIEHASLVPDEWLPAVRDAQITVVTQPNFVAERGDSYIKALTAHEHDWLYRAHSLLAAGVPLAAGTDAPFGDANPWRAMQAAVDRRTPTGQILGNDEVLPPEAACLLFLGSAADPAGAPRSITVGAAADLCLLDRPWTAARSALAAVKVRLSLRDGTIIWHSRHEAGGCIASDHAATGLAPAACLAAM